MRGLNWPLPLAVRDGITANLTGSREGNTPGKSKNRLPASRYALLRFFHHREIGRIESPFALHVVEDIQTLLVLSARLFTKPLPVSE